MQKIKTLSLALSGFAVTAGSALAGNHSPQSVPEPGALSIIALAAVGGIVAYRMRKKK